MSVSQFPNATSAVMQQLIKLMEDLIPNPHPVIDDDTEVIISAYMCAAIEQIINMQQLPLYHTLDPAIMSQIKSLLDSCR
ncbi:MAG: hypothetical protein A2845_02005 [Candidatus Lloydbacteria bacterium RIFCSPHIGHO2_01_FULL_49_22]|uniref:Uncharacterized protein n=1 Tax=Candidatus Lloydbacteria bacterium RIFCSPHIGHO2_01_FULL_49_22 TaxID=1798658 RepID=A0A1G2CWF6_9BACT|nr:MAG: hypothetical protein A2845_02005 [Candidatus Lloydbacteria bacterium RIFCSPHIGHO2_01_FULL_49_22]OGZ09616.1 MAG: hypothetical protein A3C14_05980 [Candidatus Lloydbacteria bacterium RIFCSPHIGHO2_02_FULL_50_18]